jgi:hypothetical protein
MAMTTWDEVYAPLGRPTRPIAAPAPAGRRPSWTTIGATGVAVALLAAILLGPGRAPPRTDPPAPEAKVERPAPVAAPHLVLRPSTPPPIAEAPAATVPEVVEPAVKIARRTQPTGGPLIAR